MTNEEMQEAIALLKLQVAQLQDRMRTLEVAHNAGAPVMIPGFDS